MLIFLAYMWFGGYKGGKPIETDWTKVKEQMIEAGDVEAITFITNTGRGEVTIRKDSLKKYQSYFGNNEPLANVAHFWFQMGPNFDSDKELGEIRSSLPQEKRFDIKNREQKNYLGILDWLLFPILLLLLWFFMIRRMSRNMGGGAAGGGDCAAASRSVGFYSVVGHFVECARRDERTYVVCPRVEEDDEDENLVSCTRLYAEKRAIVEERLAQYAASAADGGGQHNAAQRN